MTSQYLRPHHELFIPFSHLWKKQNGLPHSFLIPHLISSTIRQLRLNSNNSKAYIPHRLVQPAQVESFICQSHSSIWTPLHDVGPGLKRGSVLTIASWNLNWSSPDPASRTLAALRHLEHLFGSKAQNLVVMLQEVSSLSLSNILGHGWVQQNFILSDIKPPRVPRRVTLSTSSALTKSIQKEASYFTVIMVSKNLPVMACFRVPLITNMGRDVLAMDLLILANEATNDHLNCVRLCTTHLESLWKGKEYRRGQLAVISDLFEYQVLPGRKVIAGVIGGDMNSTDMSEHGYHKESHVHLRDMWEDGQISTPKNESHQHEEDGATWGHKSSYRGSKRLDKFLYSGAAETLTFEDFPGCEQRVRRFAVGLETEIGVWELEREDAEVVRGQTVKKLRKEYVSEEHFNTLKELGFLKSYRARQIKMKAGVSDHCGIMARIKII